MEKKAIAFVIGSLSSGGAERVVSTLCNQLIDTYHVYVITFKNVKPFYPLDERVVILPCFESITSSSNIFQSLKLNYLLYTKVSGFLKSKKIALCIGFLTSGNVISVLAAKFNRIPVVISERNDPNSINKPFFWEKLRKLTYPKADYLIVQTEEIKQFFSPWIENSKLKILPNPLSPDLNFQSYQIESRENIVLNVGRLTDQKGQGLLIQAFSKLNPVGWKLIVIGEGINRPLYENLIKNLGMEKKILLVGRKKDISKHYNSAKIFAFPSRFEGFPNALIEAMYMGLPCIATNCPTGPSELITNGTNGFLVEVDDEISFREKLQLLIENQELRAEFSKRGKEEVERFSVDNVVGEWRKTILSALNL